MGMITPDIAGLCERLRAPKPGVLMDITGILHPKDRANPDGPDAADTLERQAAEIKRMRVALERIADPRNIHFAGDAQVVARAALTGEDTATLGFSGKTQTDARTRGD